MSLSVALATPSLQTCSLIVENYTADTVSLKYNTLSGNQPATYLNSVMIWEASVIPWTVPPITSEQIPQNGQSGTFVMSGFVISNSQYIIGYAVGNQVTDICATAQISAGGLRAPANSVYISIASMDEESITVNYFTLSGYLPKAYGNWIGLWEGYASPFNAPKPLARMNVKSNANQGTVTFTDLELKPGTVYTLVYFMGANQGQGWPRTITNAAAILNIQTTASDLRSTGKLILLP